MYGQTTSGKTYTMLGSESSPGVLPCAIRDIFKGIALVSNFKFNRHFQQEKTKQA
jgi:centromeric protein E